MRGWLGTVLAIVAIGMALFLDPVNSLGLATIKIDVRALFIAVLIFTAGVAFLLGTKTRETHLSHHMAIWSAAGLMLVILVTNFGSLKNTVVEQAGLNKKIEKKKLQLKDIVIKRKKKRRADLLEPDTPKLERVEKVLKLEDVYPRRFDLKPDKHVGPIFSKNSTLADTGVPSEDDKKRFKAFLESQGLKYNPDTAFSSPKGDDG